MGTMNISLPDALKSFVDEQVNLGSYGTSSAYSATGSPRYTHELNLPELRFWPITKYPHLAFYDEQPQHIDVWGVLHGEQDIPVLMQQNTESLMPSDLRQRKA
jgi:toxin ParE1/3/4